MAKAKKTTDDAAEPAAKKKTAARKTPARKPAAKKAAASGAAAAPTIDTGLAAQSAARMLLARASGGTAPAAAQGASSDFQQFKDSLNKPKGALDNLLHTTAPKNVTRSNTPFQQQKQVGHNQTFGADVNRTGVPRRNPG